MSIQFILCLKKTRSHSVRIGLKDRVHCFSMQVVMNFKCFFLNP